jgi:superfamily II DNA or RNA helicase
MAIRLLVRDREFKFPWSRDVVDVLKKFAVFDPNHKTWYTSQVPCWAAKALSLPVDCTEVKWYKFYAYVSMPDDVVKKHTCYKVKTWKPVSCEFYCQTPSCVRRCIEEGWNPVTQVEETICLAKKTDRGDWAVPRGLVPRLTNKYQKYVETLKPVTDFEDLRHYQIEMIKNAWTRLEDIGVTLWQAATGAGKSRIMGKLAAELAKNGYTVVMSALQLDLVYQMLDFAKIYAKDTDTLKRIHGVTIQTLYSRLFRRRIEETVSDGEEKQYYKHYADETPQVNEMVWELLDRSDVAFFLDEAHHAPAETVWRLSQRIGYGAALRIGATATPEREDGHDLKIFAAFGDVVPPAVTSSDLIRWGFAVPVEIRVVTAPRCNYQEKCRGVSGASEYACIRKALVECEERNKLAVQLAQMVDKPFLVITQLVEHAKLVGRMMKAVGLNVEVVTGAVKGEVRQEIYSKLRNGTIDGIVATQLADEGLDIKELRTGIFLLSGKSRTRIRQRVGRFVRPAPDKSIAVVYDIYDRDVPFFEDHFQQRLEIYKTEPEWRITWLK